MKRRIIVGISGASGAIYGVRLLQQLRALGGVETHLVVSEGGARTLAVETDWRLDDLRGLCDVWHRHDNLAASIAPYVLSCLPSRRFAPRSPPSPVRASGGALPRPPAPFRCSRARGRTRAEGTRRSDLGAWS